MKFFQRALNNTNSYCECKKSEATYYQNEAGSMKPIGQLLTNDNNIVSNVPQKPTHEPLGLPSMSDMIHENSGQVTHNVTISKSENNQLGLGVPSLTELIMKEASKRNKFISQNVRPTTNPNYDKNGLPSMENMIKQQSR